MMGERAGGSVAVEHYRVTWFPFDVPQRSKSFTSEDSEANREKAVALYEEAKVEGFSPFLEMREVTAWDIIRNSVGLGG